MNQFTEVLNARHKKGDFSCGKDMPDNYWHRQAHQDVKRRLSACFILEDLESRLIKGY